MTDRLLDLLCRFNGRREQKTWDAVHAQAAEQYDYQRFEGQRIAVQKSGYRFSHSGGE